MATFTSRDKLKSGVPLGGIGAGKLEILSNGLFNAFTFLNNWSKPITGTREYPGILGFHFGVFEEPADRPGRTVSETKAFLLQTSPVAGIPTVKSIRYEGIFPRVVLNYVEPLLGLEVTLEAWSPWIPGNSKDSSLPVCYFTLKVKNKRDYPVNTGLLFMGRNICGAWCVGRENRVHNGPRTIHLEFTNHDPAKGNPASGTLRFSFQKSGWHTSFMESWNAVTKNFFFDPRNIRLKAWEYFVEEGTLPDSCDGEEAFGENREFCGAVGASGTLMPKAEKTWPFIAAWHFPNHAPGHHYAVYFKNASSVASYALRSRGRLDKKVKRVHELVFAMPFPRWFNDALLSNLYPFFSSTWFVKDGRTAFYEAPVVCPLMGTLDVGFYGSIPLSFFFPDLERSQITQFARAQRPDGYIPHDLGRDRLDLPSNGTTFYLWKDLNPKFILMVWRDFLWGGRKIRFLKELYPAVRRALLWAVNTDSDGDGLPDHEGTDHTFDLWVFEGANPYTSGIFLAALMACRRMAVIMGDESFARQCERHFLKGRRTFEKKLWNGKYFGDTCSLAQLAGQWYADLLDLGYIADRQKIKKALGFILKHNSAHSRFGMVNSVLSDGRLDTSNDHSRNLWAGVNYAFVSLCLTQGFPLTNLLIQTRKIWDNVTRQQKNPWNQPDTVDSKTGHYVFGDSYYRNMSIWSIPIAYARRDKKTKKLLDLLREM